MSLFILVFKTQPRRQPASVRALSMRAVSILAASVLAACLLLTTCAGKPPEIGALFWQHNLVDDREQDLLYYALSVFVQASDADGSEDLEEVYIIHDDEELFWRLDRETWLTRTQGDTSWVGSNSISLPEGRMLPGGEYRVLVTDAGGDSAETSFILKTQNMIEPRRLLPTVTVDADTIRVAGGRKSYAVWLYDAAGKFTTALLLEQTRFSIRQILAAHPDLASGFSFRIHGTPQGGELGFVSGPYYVQP
jgi:hypothetical protein